jgi:hypothetical protein
LSIPWGAADKRNIPIDLIASGYVEEEYFLTGTALLYDWPDTSKSAVLKSSSILYTT